MISQEIRQKLKEIVCSCLNQHNLELVEINYSRTARPVLTILIDRPQGGITIGECTLMNNILSEALDSSGILTSGYFLEVSSPGVDRPLKEKSDFSRVIDKKVKCFLREAISAEKEVGGLVVQVDDEFVTLETNNGLLRVPLSSINKAKQVVD
jgi:ribosome maturation factor RimP